MRFPRLFWLLFGCLALRAADAPPHLVLRTNDVIAFIGGANMVALAQSGHLETLLTFQHPHHKLRFRSLAWEGDTVFAQPRDVNYPDLVTQLKQVGATVAFVQFGQMESLAGEAGLTNFVAAYKQLLDRIGKVCPRLVVIPPNAWEHGHYRSINWQDPKDQELKRYCQIILKLAQERNLSVWALEAVAAPATTSVSRDGVQFSPYVEMVNNILFLPYYADADALSPAWLKPREALRSAIAEKNRLWFDYARPSNWAFLAGDRTEQAFSRDHRDRNIRAFAQEMQQFVPLIADAEKRIDELAVKAAAEKESTR